MSADFSALDILYPCSTFRSSNGTLKKYVPVPER